MVIVFVFIVLGRRLWFYNNTWENMKNGSVITSLQDSMIFQMKKNTPYKVT